jgi:hypothetical protein
MITITLRPADGGTGVVLPLTVGFGLVGVGLGEQVLCLVPQLRPPGATPAVVPDDAEFVATS